MIMALLLWRASTNGSPQCHDGKQRSHRQLSSKKNQKQSWKLFGGLLDFDYQMSKSRVR